MKKKLLSILSLGLLATLAVGCTPKKNKSSADSSTPSSSSSEPAEVTWSSALQTLMEKWCGEVLPYAEGIGNYKFEEDDEGLYIYDEASAFAIEDYWADLEDADWESSLNEEGEHDLYDSQSDSYYYQNYKTEDNIDYSVVQYYFDETYGNMIVVFGEAMSTTKTTATSWSEDDLGYMESELSVVLPFMAFGEDYEWQYGGGTMEAQMFDYYYQDLTEDYYTLLQGQGFTLVTSGDYAGLLSKNTDDGNTLYVGGYWEPLYGNVIISFLEVSKTTVDTWPTNLVAQYSGQDKFVIPSFQSEKYTYYVFSGQLVIEGDGDDETIDNYADSCEAIGLLIMPDPYYAMFGYYYPLGAYDWTETFFVTFNEQMDEEYSVYGFGISVGATTPTSEFSSTWPSQAVNDFVSGLGEDMPGIPAAAKTSTEDFKYYVTEDDSGDYLTISAIDKGEPGKDAMEDTYLEVFESIPWYVDYSQYEKLGYVAEDPNGKVKVTFYSYNGVFVCYIEAGSGEVHEPSLTLSKTELTLKPGMTYFLTATKSMIADDVVFSSSNPSVVDVNETSGKIIVANDAPIDSTVTITATAGSYHAECVVTIKAKLDFTKITTADELTDGAYLIVCESQGAVMKGATPEDAVSNKIDVEVNEGTIAYSDELAAEAFTFIESSDGWTIQGGDNKYIGRAGDSNGLDIKSEAVYNDISFDADGNVDIVGAGGAHLRFNKSSGQTRFRYFKSTTYSNQTAIQLYEVII